MNTFPAESRYSSDRQASPPPPPAAPPVLTRIAHRDAPRDEADVAAADSNTNTTTSQHAGSAADSNTNTTTSQHAGSGSGFGSGSGSGSGTDGHSRSGRDSGDGDGTDAGSRSRPGSSGSGEPQRRRHKIPPPPQSRPAAARGVPTDPALKTIPAPESGSNLFVAGLPSTVDDAVLAETFRGLGRVVSAKVMLHVDTGESRGFGFVLYATAAEAEAARAALHGTAIAGHGGRLQLSVSKHRGENLTAESRVVYVRNLPPSLLGSAELSAFLEQFGQVAKVVSRVSSDGSGGTNVVVTFGSVEAARACVAGCHGKSPFAACTVPLLSKMEEPQTLRDQRLREHMRPGRGGTTERGGARGALGPPPAPDRGPPGRRDRAKPATRGCDAGEPPRAATTTSASAAAVPAAPHLAPYAYATPPFMPPPFTGGGMMPMAFHMLPPMPLPPGPPMLPYPAGGGFGFPPFQWQLPPPPVHDAGGGAMQFVGTGATCRTWPPTPFTPLHECGAMFGAGFAPAAGQRMGTVTTFPSPATPAGGAMQPHAPRAALPFGAAYGGQGPFASLRDGGGSTFGAGIAPPPGRGWAP